MERILPLNSIIMKKLTLAALLLVVFAVACKQQNDHLLVKKWQAVSLESPMLDAQIAEERRFIDTVGKTTDPETNERLYGVRNMDSMRLLLHAQMDSFIEMQSQTIRNTWLDFDKNGTVVSSFGSQPDTVAWYLDDDGALILDEMKQKGSGSKIKMEVVKLDADTLKLRFNENGFSSTATFIPASR